MQKAKKRRFATIFVSAFLGLLFGLICAYSGTKRGYINDLWMFVSTVYNRSFIGFVTGLTYESDKFVKELVKASLWGFFVSALMVLYNGPLAAIGFGIFGIIWSVLILLGLKVFEKFYKK